METWKLLLITLLSAVLIGCLCGVLVGKHQLKKKRGDYKPLLSSKERIIYSVSILVGAACIAFGLLYASPAEEAVNMEGFDEGSFEGGMLEDGLFEGGAMEDGLSGEDAFGEEGLSDEGAMEGETADDHAAADTAGETTGSGGAAAAEVEAVEVLMG